MMTGTAAAGPESSGQPQMTGTTAGGGQEDGEGWHGLSLLADELAATGQAIGAITGAGHRQAVHRELLTARLGELRAAIDFAVARNALDWEAVNQQRDRRRARYEASHAPQPEA